ncbi:MAG: helix-turn-helix domain-containing protein [Propionibacteriaceae bacterium]|nr:helix-turn-helix domain-containing protein [Propionibacteriaceae bacterium]
MDDQRERFIAVCDAQLRLVRTEAGLNQEEMAYAVGLSKKTLVDIEKGRRTLGWMGAVALCSVFASSPVLSWAFGGSPAEMIPALARSGQPVVTGQTGTNPWWEVVADNGTFIIEQNIISQHYRLLSASRTKIAASFDIDDLMPMFTNKPQES